MTARLAAPSFWQNPRRALLSWQMLAGLLYGAVAGATLGLLIIVDRRAEPARPLEDGARAYCDSAEAEREAIDRRLFYRLPDGISVEIRCAR